MRVYGTVTKITYNATIPESIGKLDSVESSNGVWMMKLEDMHNEKNNNIKGFKMEPEKYLRENRKNLTEEEKEEIRRTDADSFQNFKKRTMLLCRDSIESFVEEVKKEADSEFDREADEAMADFWRHKGYNVYRDEEDNWVFEGDDDTLEKLVKEAEDKALGFV